MSILFHELPGLLPINNNLPPVIHFHSSEAPIVLAWSNSNHQSLTTHKIKTMKKTRILPVTFLLYCVIFLSCANHSEGQAKSETEKTSETIKTNRGDVATTASGYMMNANVNGEAWAASSMMPPEAAGRIIGYKKNDYIGLPYDGHMKAGDKIKLGEHDGVDIFFSENNGSWRTTGGEIEITQIADGWMEGKFTVTEKEADKGRNIEITNGYFRIPQPKK